MKLSQKVRHHVFSETQCMYVCNTITFENLDAGTPFSHIRYITWGYGPSSYMKIIG